MDFKEIVTTLKIPTLSLIRALFYFGCDLTKSAPNLISQAGISGAIILCIAAILSMMIFIDYRYKEQNDHIVSQQGKAIDNLSKALKNTSETHSKIERATQSALVQESDKIGKEGSKQYSIQNKQETPTD